MEYACTKGSIEAVRLLAAEADIPNAGNLLVCADGREEIFDFLLTLDCRVNFERVCVVFFTLIPRSHGISRKKQAVTSLPNRCVFYKKSGSEI